MPMTTAAAAPKSDPSGPKRLLVGDGLIVHPAHHRQLGVVLRHGIHRDVTARRVDRGAVHAVSDARRGRDVAHRHAQRRAHLELGGRVGDFLLDVLVVLGAVLEILLLLDFLDLVAELATPAIRHQPAEEALHVLRAGAQAAQGAAHHRRHRLGNGRALGLRLRRRQIIAAGRGAPAQNRLDRNRAALVQRLGLDRDLARVTRHHRAVHEGFGFELVVGKAHRHADLGHAGLVLAGFLGRIDLAILARHRLGVVAFGHRAHRGARNRALVIGDGLDGDVAAHIADRARCRVGRVLQARFQTRAGTDVHRGFAQHHRHAHADHGGHCAQLARQQGHGDIVRDLGLDGDGLGGDHRALHVDVRVILQHAHADAGHLGHQGAQRHRGRRGRRDGDVAVGHQPRLRAHIDRRLVGDARPRRHGAGAVQELHQRIKRGIHPARQHRSPGCRSWSSG
ncbi:hypothetical protein G6F57_015302 [Rhizopus arrhizus]|nr:hypothetical protein G6F57_015302 [Rhizopus arrhizus]